MSALDFVPRLVKRRKVEQSSKPAQAESSNSSINMSLAPAPAASQALSQREQPQISGNGTRTWPLFKPEQTIRNYNNSGSPELAILIWLALSDHSIWTDDNLKQSLGVGCYQQGSVGWIKQEEADNVPGTSNIAVKIEEEPTTLNTTDDIGYIPLSSLIEDSPVFYLVSLFARYTKQSETAFVKSIRTFAKGVLDVRLIIDPDASSATRTSLSKYRKTKNLMSGYEVRRTPLLPFRDSSFSKEGWDQLTIYVENIPTDFRKLPEIARLIILLLPPLANPENEVSRVQHIFLPPHHQDKPGDIPVCKGFALVTLSSKDDLEHLLRRWPWEVQPEPVKARASSTRRSEQSRESSYESNPEVPKKPEKRRGRSGRAEAQLARSTGLRVCTKARWEELRTEYLAYGQRLADELAEYQDSHHVKLEEQDGSSALSKGCSVAAIPERTLTSRENASIKADSEDSEDAGTTRGNKRKRHQRNETLLIKNLGYPIGCLVFVRNVHFGTNRTTLKMLFKRPWMEGETPFSAGSHNDTGVSYVDYTRNMDACYVRCFTPNHAQQFFDYFSKRQVVQTDGLDGAGSDMVQSTEPLPSSSDVKPIDVELIGGTREKIYLESQSSKVRNQAVEETLTALGGQIQAAGTKTGENETKNRQKRARHTIEEMKMEDQS